MLDLALPTLKPKEITTIVLPTTLHKITAEYPRGKSENDSEEKYNDGNFVRRIYDSNDNAPAIGSTFCITKLRAILATALLDLKETVQVFKYAILTCLS
jgi:hypothetical protein